MKRLINISLVLAATLILTSSVFAQNGQGNRFGLNGGVNPGSLWVDADGDGICDNYGTNNQGTGLRNGAGRMNGRNASGLGLFKGYGDGSEIRPQDGTGFGRAGGSGLGTGTGVCDGSGPKGSGRRGNN